MMNTKKKYSPQSRVIVCFFRTVKAETLAPMVTDLNTTLDLKILYLQHRSSCSFAGCENSFRAYCHFMRLVIFLALCSVG